VNQVIASLSKRTSQMEIEQPEEIDIFKNIKRDTDSSISMIYVQDKKT
jgi:hypothetical protein